MPRILPHSLDFPPEREYLPAIYLQGGDGDMEKLGSSTLPQGLSKFVREGEVIAYDDIFTAHADIAKAADLGEPTGTVIGGVEFRFIDDAGEVVLRRGTLIFSGLSSSCDLRGSPAQARATTLEVAGILTGMPVEASR